MDRDDRQLFHLDVRFPTSLVPTVLDRFDPEPDTVVSVTQTEFIKRHSWINVEVYGTPGRARQVIQLCRRWGGIVRIVDQDALCA